MDNPKLEVGKVYHVLMEDCCVGGEFTSLLLNILDEKCIEYYASKENPILIFENGVTITKIWGCTIREKLEDAITIKD